MPVSIRFYLDIEVNAELLDELDLEYTYEEDYCVVSMEIDETLLESLDAEEMLEFIGLDAENLVYVEVLD